MTGPGPVTPDASREPSDQHLGEGHSIARSTVLAFLVKMTGAVFTAFLTIFLARVLGSREYGLFSVAVGISGLAVLPSDFGVSNAVARFVAERRDERSRVQAILADGLRIKLLAAVTLSAVLIVLAKPIANAYGLPGLVWPLRGMAVALFGQSVMLMAGVFVAVGRIDHQLRTAFAESATETVASVTLVLAGAGAAGAAFGQAAGYAVGAGVTVVLLKRFFGGAVMPGGLRLGAEARRIVGYGGVLLIVDSAYTAFTQIDVLIIGAYAGASAAGTFSAPMKLITFFGYPGSAMSSGVSPRITRGAVGGPNTAAFLAALRLLLIVQAGITAFVLGWAHLLIQIGLGGGYAPSVGVLRALSPYVFLLGFGTLVSISVNYLGEGARRVPVALVTLGVNVGLDLWLVPKLGAIGGAIGTDVAYALYAPAHLYLCQRSLGLDLRPALLTFARTSLAGAALTGVLLLFGDPLSLGEVWRTALGGLVGLVVFGIVLWMTREVSSAEVRERLRGALP